MAKITVSYNCGCGFRTENLAEAVLHSDTLNHSLDVTGAIKSDGKNLLNEIALGHGGQALTKKREE